MQNGKFIVFDRVVGKNSYHYHILVILKKEKKPMSAIQLLTKIRKVKKITSKTPDATIRSILTRSSFIENTGYGHYKIKSNAKIPEL